MSAFKRILVFFGSFVLLRLAIFFVAGAVIASGVLHSPVAHRGPHLLWFHAALLFVIKYHPLINALCILFSALIAFGFRFLTLLFAVPVALAVFIWFQRFSAIQEARFGAFQFNKRLVAALEADSAAPTETPTPAGSPTPAPRMQAHVGDKVRLLSPVSVRVDYGAVTLPKGTVVTVVSEGQDALRVEAPNGWSASVPVTEVEP